MKKGVFLMDGNFLLTTVFQNGRKVFKKKTKQGIWKTILRIRRFCCRKKEILMVLSLFFM